jgi:hypothetical protein
MGLLTAILIHILETLFVIGMLGSGMVIIVAGIEDIASILEDENTTPSGEKLT